MEGSLMSWAWMDKHQHLLDTCYLLGTSCGLSHLAHSKDHCLHLLEKETKMTKKDISRMTAQVFKNLEVPGWLNQLSIRF